jgi:hypothetical protein
MCLEFLAPSWLTALVARSEHSTVTIHQMVGDVSGLCSRCHPTEDGPVDDTAGGVMRVLHLQGHGMLLAGRRKPKPDYGLDLNTTIRTTGLGS